MLLLGIVSVATAYTSFQSALYDSQMAGAYTRGQNAQTEAESLYLEANQQYILDVQTWARLTELTTDMDSADPVLASLRIREVRQHLLRLGRTRTSRRRSPGRTSRTTPTPTTTRARSTPRTTRTRCSAPGPRKTTRSEALIKEGDVYNGYSDRLTLNTVLMAITLFLLGVAAVVRRRQTQWILVGFGSAIFVVAAVLTVIVPFVGLG